MKWLKFPENEEGFEEVFLGGTAPRAMDLMGVWWVKMLTGPVRTGWLGHCKYFFAAAGGRAIGFNAFFQHLIKWRFFIFLQQLTRWGYFNVGTSEDIGVSTILIDYNLLDNPAMVRKIADHIRQITISLEDGSQEKIYLGQFHYGGRMRAWFLLSRKRP